jgi:hypothetical protein
MFFFSQNIDFHFLFAETLGAFLFPFFFQYFLSLSFFQCSIFLRTWGFDDKQGEKHSLNFSFKIKLNGMAKP